LQTSRGGGATPGSRRAVSFATSNDGKFREVSFVLRRLGIDLLRLPGKGLEIQSDDVGEIAKFGADKAARAYGKPVVVEDTGLFVDALGGFPGPYASFVFRSIGLAGVLKLLRGGRERRARFESAVAYCEPGTRPRVFRGMVRGRIAMGAFGREGFGFDPIFIPDALSVTLAQMKIEAKCEVSHRGEAARKFGLWYAKKAQRTFISPNSKMALELRGLGANSLAQARKVSPDQTHDQEGASLGELYRGGTEGPHDQARQGGLDSKSGGDNA